jgi:hypothetical protein
MVADMNEEQLMLVEEGLAKMLKRFKQNTNADDNRRLKATQDAKTAIRKVILAVAIKGDIKEITPIQSDNGIKIGWEVIDKNDKIIKYF